MIRLMNFLLRLLMGILWQICLCMAGMNRLERLDVPINGMTSKQQRTMVISFFIMEIRLLYFMVPTRGLIRNLEK